MKMLKLYIIICFILLITFSFAQVTNSLNNFQKNIISVSAGL